MCVYVYTCMLCVRVYVYSILYTTEQTLPWMDMVECHIGVGVVW